MPKKVVIRTRLKSPELKKMLKELPGILSGRKPNKYRLYQVFWGAVAFSMFHSISAAYKQKSKGQEDELGNTWPDLDRDYKAYKRPVQPGDLAPNLRRRLKPSVNTLGLLSPSQHKRWQQFFGIIYHAYKHKMPDDEAKALAGQIAWTRIKEEGAVTKRQVLGDRKLLIMQVSGRLLVSLSPGKFNPSSGYTKRNSNQVFELQKGRISIGTKIDYASHHDKTRPVWPEDVDAWIDRAMDDGLNAVQARLFTVLR